MEDLNMKALVLLVIVLSSLAVAGCGGAGEGAGSTVNASVAATGRSSAIPNIRSLKGDGDADNPNDIDEDEVADHDPDDDSPTRESTSYHDHDDANILSYGGTPSAADERIVTALAKRYYAAAAADDGAMACSLILSGMAKTLPEDYGGRTGPAYLRGGKTCRAIMSLLFKHFHGSLTSVIKVTGVRVKGDRAYALLSSTTRPASYLTLRREAGAWKVEELLAVTLP